jgi:uncharacterized protein YegJ (DUF2314 family)
MRAGRPTDVHVGPGRYTGNDRGSPPVAIEGYMYRVARRPLSKLIALLPAADPPPTFEELERLVSRACLPATLRQNASGSRIRALLQEPGGMRRFDVEINLTELLPQYPELARLPGGGFDRSLASQFFLSVSCKLGRDMLDSLHAQIRMLAALAPDAVAVIDVNAFHVKKGDWLRDAASASVPPAPTSFFSVQSFVDDHKKAWLHTHGLQRMGSIDLDIVGVRRRDVPALSELINHVAKHFIDCGVPLPNTRFQAGNDLPLVWLPWEAGLQHLDEGPGGAAHRDADHTGERGILFAPSQESPERLESPRCYVRRIEVDPIFYVSRAETERMQRLARERLPSFLALQSRFAENKKWNFHVKLGLPTDGDGHRYCVEHDGDGGAEHLWFDVHKATAKSVEGTLLNQPYRIASLREGQRGTFDLRLLTDWAIESPRGRYTPESVLQLERGLANDRVSARPLLH